MWCTSQDMWVSAAHIPGTEKTDKDNFSRNFSKAIDWKLNSYFFQKISRMFRNTTFYRFVSCINHQVDKYFLKTRPKIYSN